MKYFKKILGQVWSFIGFTLSVAVIIILIILSHYAVQDYFNPLT